MNTPAPPDGWTAVLLDQLTFHWDNQLRPKLEGLTDAEYVWEPVAGCWSVRPRDEATAPALGGSGDHVSEFAFPEPDPAPVTTIAWRLVHLIVGVYGARIASHFHGPPIDYFTYDHPATAAAAVADLDAAHHRWVAGVGQLGEDDLSRPAGDGRHRSCLLPGRTRTASLDPRGSRGHTPASGRSIGCARAVRQPHRPSPHPAHRRPQGSPPAATVDRGPHCGSEPAQPCPPAYVVSAEPVRPARSIEDAAVEHHEPDGTRFAGNARCTPATTAPTTMTAPGGWSPTAWLASYATSQM